MDIRWRQRAERVSEDGVVHEPWNICTLSTGWFTPSPAPPPPFTAACFSRRRGRLTTNGLHLSLPLELSNRPGPPQSYATGIALDPIGRMIYWIDDEADRIQRANLDGTEIQDIVISGLAWPHGLAVDPVNKKLYWTHRRHGNITRANLDGTGIEDLMPEGSLDEPNEIALDPISQKMYWTEQAVGDVRRANLDGSGIEGVVISDALEVYGIALH